MKTSFKIRTSIITCTLSDQQGLWHVLDHESSVACRHSFAPLIQVLFSVSSWAKYTGRVKDKPCPMLRTSYHCTVWVTYFSSWWAKGCLGQRFLNWGPWTPEDCNGMLGSPQIKKKTKIILNVFWGCQSYSIKILIKCLIQ